MKRISWICNDIFLSLLCGCAALRAAGWLVVAAVATVGFWGEAISAAMSQEAGTPVTAPSRLPAEWAGTWTVTDPNGDAVSRARIRSARDGSVLRWTCETARGAASDMLLFRDPGDRLLHLIHVDHDGTVLRGSGRLTGSNLEVEGQRTFASGQVATICLRVTLADADTLVWRLETQQAEAPESGPQSAMVEERRYRRAEEQLPVSNFPAPELTDPDGGAPLWFAGHWEVWLPTRKLAGTDRIVSHFRHRLFVQEWSGAENGLTSFLYYDPAQSNWHRIGVDSRGGVFRVEGALEGVRLGMAGERTAPDGSVTPCRWTLTRNTNGTLLSLDEESDDQGVTWTTSFYGKYIQPAG